MSIEGGPRGGESGSFGIEGNPEAGAGSRGSRLKADEVYSIMHNLARTDRRLAHELLILAYRIFKTSDEAYEWFFTENEFLRSLPAEILKTEHWEYVLTALEDDIATGYFGEQDG